MSRKSKPLPGESDETDERSPEEELAIDKESKADDDEAFVHPPPETIVPHDAISKGGTSHFDFVVAKQFNDDRRLDAYVVARLSRIEQVSRAEVQRWILNFWLTLNGKKAKASHRVRQGDHIVIDLPDELDKKPEPQEIPLEILFEDDHLVVLNKQANLIVHPGRGKENWSGTLTNGLQYHFDRLSTAGGIARPGIIHRLDRDTTGVIVVAKDDYSHKMVALQFERRQVSKEYLAICYGVIDRDRDHIIKPIGPHPAIREKMAIREDPAIGRPANTFFEVMERFDGYTMVHLKPMTGRTHQIRVHLTHIGAPIVADKPYAGRTALRLSELVEGILPEHDQVLIERQALHAHRLKFRHPHTQLEIDITAPLPADMQRTLDALQKYRRKK